MPPKKKPTRGPTDAASAPGAEGQNLEVTEIRSGVINGVTFTNKTVQYAVVGDLAILEGDIVLGTVEEVDRATELAHAAQDGLVAHGVGVVGSQYRWPNALMPYEIDPALPNKARVTDAIAHWEANTNMRFVLRTAANAASYPNYVRVFPGDGCWSYVGMQGGQQLLSLTAACSTGSTIHEFGHAWGLWHEQSREDRNTFVRIEWANIQAGKESNFNQHISDGDDLGGYDYGSIMHYGSHAFSKNNKPTIVQLQGGPTIGQRTQLSAGDIAAVHAMYRTMHLNLTVSRVFATPSSKNAWAAFPGTGWRKVHANDAAGVTNTFAIIAAARANNRRVHVEMDGAHIYQAYGV